MYLTRAEHRLAEFIRDDDHRISINGRMVEMKDSRGRVIGHARSRTLQALQDKGAVKVGAKPGDSQTRFLVTPDYLARILGEKLEKDELDGGGYRI